MMKLVLPAFLIAIIATSAAAHDAPLAFVEAVQTHLNDCGLDIGYQKDGKLLSPGWEVLEEPDEILTDRIEGFLNGGTATHRNVNVFKKTVAGYEIIQVMASRSSDSKTELNCGTSIRELPFAPNGSLLEAMIGTEMSAGVENAPGDLRTGWWKWDSLETGHLGTIAAYSNSYSSLESLPDSAFSPGFYIVSSHEFDAPQ